MARSAAAALSEDGIPQLIGAGGCIARASGIGHSSARGSTRCPAVSNRLGRRRGRPGSATRRAPTCRRLFLDPVEATAPTTSLIGRSGTILAKDVKVARGDDPRQDVKMVRRDDTAGLAAASGSSTMLSVGASRALAQFKGNSAIRWPVAYPPKAVLRARSPSRFGYRSLVLALQARGCGETVYASRVRALRSRRGALRGLGRATPSGTVRREGRPLVFALRSPLALRSAPAPRSALAAAGYIGRRPRPRPGAVGPPRAMRSAPVSPHGPSIIDRPERLRGFGFGAGLSIVRGFAAPAPAEC